MQWCQLKRKKQGKRANRNLSKTNSQKTTEICNRSPKTFVVGLPRQKGLMRFNETCCTQIVAINIIWSLLTFHFTYLHKCVGSNLTITKKSPKASMPEKKNILVPGRRWQLYIKSYNLTGLNFENFQKCSRIYMLILAQLSTQNYLQVPLTFVVIPW